MSVFKKDLSLVFVAHGLAVPAIRRVHDAFEQVQEVKRIDLTDDAEVPRLDDAKHQRMMAAFRKRNAALILGLNQWSNVDSGGYSEENPGESDALYYASGRHVYGEPTNAVATCIITDSLDRLDPILSSRRSNFEEREKIRLVAVYGQEGGHMGRKVYELLIRRFPNLEAPNFLCFKVMDDKAAKLIASRIRQLV